MRIEVTGRHMDLTPAIVQYAEQKCGKLTRYYDGLQEVHVVIDQAKHGEFTVELKSAVVAHEDFVVKQNEDDVYKCIDLAVDRMERQLTEFKERLKNGKKR